MKIEIIAEELKAAIRERCLMMDGLSAARDEKYFKRLDELDGFISICICMIVRSVGGCNANSN